MWAVPRRRRDRGRARPDHLRQPAYQWHRDRAHACEKSCACTTCHVIVRDGFDSLEAAEELEEDLLDKAWGLGPQSRLSCQGRRGFHAADRGDPQVFHQHGPGGEQLWGSIVAVFESWNNERAGCTAPCTKSPSLGHCRERSREWCSATCTPTAEQVLPSPATLPPARIFSTEGTMNAQGEDVVAGIRTPQQVTLEGSRAVGPPWPG